MKHPRFISAARCPECGTLDSLKISGEDNAEKIECICCDFQQFQTEKQNLSKKMDIPIKNI